MTLATDPNETSARLSDMREADVRDEIADLSTKAERCRRLAAGISDRQASDVLRSMADGYEQSAARLSSSD